jgi:hypothetical protein
VKPLQAAFSDFVCPASVQRLAQRMTVHNGCHVSGLAKFIAKPSAQFSILHFLHDKPDACGENLPNARFSRSFGTMVLHALAELRQHRLKRSFGFMVHDADHDRWLSCKEANFTIKPNGYSLKRPTVCERRAPQVGVNHPQMRALRLLVEPQ